MEAMVETIAEARPPEDLHQRILVAAEQVTASLSEHFEHLQNVSEHLSDMRYSGLPAAETIRQASERLAAAVDNGPEMINQAKTLAKVFIAFVRLESFEFDQSTKYFRVFDCL